MTRMEKIAERVFSGQSLQGAEVTVQSCKPERG